MAVFGARQLGPVILAMEASKVRSTGSGNINSMINYLYTSGRDDTSTASSDDSDEDFRYEKNHPLCVVLPRVHLGIDH